MRNRCEPCVNRGRRIPPSVTSAAIDEPKGSGGRRLAAIAAIVVGAALFALFGAVGVYRYLDNYWLYRGFPPPRDPAFVRDKGTVERIYVASAALGGRRQPVDVYLPPGYATHPRAHYPVFYLL